MRARRACAVPFAAVLVLAVVTSVAPPARAVAVTFPVQAMEGDRTVVPGDVVRAGYSFTMPGEHPAATVAVRSAAVTFPATCASDGTDATFAVSLADDHYLDASGDPAWYPIGDAGSARSYQGSLAVPDLCAGGAISLQRGGAFAANLVSSDNMHKVSVRWHYSVSGSAGKWSGALSSVPPQTRGQPATPTKSGAPDEIVVKIDIAQGHTIDDITTAYPVAVVDGGLASRGIYLVRPTDPSYLDDAGRLADLAKHIRSTAGVLYAQVNLPVHLADTQFHGWPWGSPTNSRRDPYAYRHQPAAAQLQLGTAQGLSTGAGAVVAVLDTGADATSPALAGRLLPGWNYLQDSDDTRDSRSGRDTSAVGHGTFVAGVVALVAPQAKIIPYRVLNGAGFGTIYGVAQAILDAVQAGADVINLSFGTDVQPQWNVLRDAVAQARAAGVVVVAASGNDANTDMHYPAAQPEALSVAALDPTGRALAAFSDHGDWVDVAAPGERVIGPVGGLRYATWAGTSMAAPFVSGAVALIKADQPAIKPDKTIAAIETSTTKLPGKPVHSGGLNVVAAIQFARTHH